MIMLVHQTGTTATAQFGPGNCKRQRRRALEIGSAVTVWKVYKGSVEEEVRTTLALEALLDNAEHLLQLHQQTHSEAPNCFTHDDQVTRAETFNNQISPYAHTTGASSFTNLVLLEFYRAPSPI